MSASRPKHRACDECRTRKLACTKEANGCQRCRREDIACVYSAQRPMGRPRKRPAAEAQSTSRSASQSASEPTPETTSSVPFPTPSPQDLGEPSFLTDQAATPSAFFDMLGLGTMDIDPSLQDTPPPPLPPPTQSPNPPGWTWEMFDMNIDFGSGENEGALVSGHDTAAATDASPHTTADTTHTPPPQMDSDKTGWLGAPNRPCGCLGRLYKALDSLQQLPTDVTAAIGVARGAAHAAHDAIACTSCAPPATSEEALAAVTTPETRPPLQMLQSLMLLGALLPAIAHAYARIVAMVDAEAARATAAQQRLPIAIQAYGGVWGRMAEWENECISTAALEASMVEPPLWRLVVRALLKVDVYGIQAGRNGECQGLMTVGKRRVDSAAADSATQDGMVPLQLGLRDIVERLEMRYRLRHACLDAAAETGLLDACEQHNCMPSSQRNCQMVIALAKREIDKLVIV